MQTYNLEYETLVCHMIIILLKFQIFFLNVDNIFKMIYDFFNRQKLNYVALL